MVYDPSRTLSPATIEVAGETFEIPTYPIYAEGNEELLEIPDESNTIIGHTFIQRQGYRFFIYDEESDNWFSLRLIRER